MMHEDEELVLSTKHVKLRIALFIIAFVVAITAFARGVLSMGEKKPGFYNVDANPSDSAPRYAAGMSLTHWFEGDSADIRRQMDELKVLYSTTLELAYKLCDAKVEYEGIANIATINHHSGEWVEIDARLYHALEDALSLSRQQQGYSVNAGPLYAVYNEILYSSDALENEEMYLSALSSPLQAFQEAAKAPDSYLSLENGCAMLTLDPGLSQSIKEAELDNVVIDLNLLQDAFVVRMLANVLEEEGWNNGYIHSSSGLTVTLSGYNAQGVMDIVGQRNGKPAKLAEMPVEGGLAICRFKVFAENEEAGYYRIEKDGKTLYRHPFPTLGGMASKMFTSYVINPSEDPVAACFENIVIQYAGDPGTLEDDWIVQPMDAGDNIVLVTNNVSRISNAECKIESLGGE